MLALLGRCKNSDNVTPIPFGHFAIAFDVMISPSVIAFAAKTLEMYYDVK